MSNIVLTLSPAHSIALTLQTQDAQQLRLDPLADGVQVSLQAFLRGEKGATGPALDAAQFLQTQALANGIFRNGSCQDGTNANMTAMTFGNFQPPPATRGYFRKQGYAMIESNDFLNLRPTDVYMLQADIRQFAQVSGTARIYVGLSEYDADGLLIDPKHITYRAVSKTTLAAPLTVGDTTIQLSSGGASWLNSGVYYSKWIAFYNYVDSFGTVYAHDANPYTRWVNSPGTALWADGGISGNVITLSNPWNYPNPQSGSGGVWPAGTVLSNALAGGTFNYRLVAGNVYPSSNNWTKLTAFIGGVTLDGSGSSASFRPGVSKVKLLVLANNSGGASDILDIANITVMKAPVSSVAKAIASL